MFAKSVKVGFRALFSSQALAQLPEAILHRHGLGIHLAVGFFGYTPPKHCCPIKLYSLDLGIPVQQGSQRKTGNEVKGTTFNVPLSLSCYSSPPSPNMPQSSRFLCYVVALVTCTTRLAGAVSVTTVSGDVKPNSYIVSTHKVTTGFVLDFKHVPFSILRLFFTMQSASHPMWAR